VDKGKNVMPEVNMAVRDSEKVSFQKGAGTLFWSIGVVTMSTSAAILNLELR
jgi:hypothetical protein